jgi:hypothetical protein
MCGRVVGIDQGWGLREGAWLGGPCVDARTPTSPAVGRHRDQASSPPRCRLGECSCPAPDSPPTLTRARTFSRPCIARSDEAKLVTSCSDGRALGPVTAGGRDVIIPLAPSLQAVHWTVRMRAVQPKAVDSPTGGTNCGALTRRRVLARRPDLPRISRLLGAWDLGIGKSGAEVAVEAFPGR